MTQRIITKLGEYLRKPSVVGYEQFFKHYLAEDFLREGYEVEEQEKLVIVRKKNTQSDKIITAHIGRQGLLVNAKQEFEYATFCQSPKEHHLSDSIGKRFLGEIMYAYNEQGEKLAQGKVEHFTETERLLFDVEIMKTLPVGTPIAYLSKLVQKEGRLSAQIDNVISVAVAYQLVQDGFDGTLLLTTEEETGKSWKHILHYLQDNNISTQQIITLDTSPYDNNHAIDEGVVVLRNRDESGMFNTQLVEQLGGKLEKADVPYEMKDEVLLKEKKHLGRTELGRIVRETNGKYNGATIQIPTIHYHTNYETTSEKALMNYYKALRLVLDF